jgi:protein-S-isoprenylcysteine O-methyltransferase Ste14
LPQTDLPPVSNFCRQENTWQKRREEDPSEVCNLRNNLFYLGELKSVHAPNEGALDPPADPCRLLPVSPARDNPVYCIGAAFSALLAVVPVRMGQTLPIKAAAFVHIALELQDATQFSSRPGIAGLLFAVWAREHLGSNWSRSVTIKQGHELITTGPYVVVRHPIYTGVLTGFLGMAIAISQVRGFIVFVLIFLAFWIKLRMEEQWMRSQFGETYATYARQTAALVPYLL